MAGCRGGLSAAGQAPTLNRAKPVTLTPASFSTCATVFLWSFTNACSRSDEVLEEPLTRPSTIFGRRLLGLALLAGISSAIAPLLLDDVGRDVVAGEVLRRHRGDVLAMSLADLGVGRRSTRPAPRSAAAGRGSCGAGSWPRTARLEAREAADLDLLAERGVGLVEQLRDGLARLDLGVEQGLDVGRPGRSPPGRPPAGELRRSASPLATKSVSQLSSRSAPTPSPTWPRPGRWTAVRPVALADVLGALDAQELDGLVEVAVGLLERLLAVHHAGAGLLTKPLDVGGSEVRHGGLVLTSSSSVARVRLGVRVQGLAGRDAVSGGGVGRTAPSASIAWSAVASTPTPAVRRSSPAGLSARSRARPEPRRPRLGGGASSAAPRRRGRWRPGPRGAPAPTRPAARRRPRRRPRACRRRATRAGHQALGDGVGDHAGQQADRADGVVVARDRVVDLVGVAVGVEDRDDRDAELARLVDRDVLLLGVDDPHRAGHARPCRGYRRGCCSSLSFSRRSTRSSFFVSRSSRRRRSRSPRAPSAAGAACAPSGSW